MNKNKTTLLKSKFKNYTIASKGFTIIEMVVTMAIIAILLLIAIPSFTGYISSAESTKTDVYAGAINTAVIQTLFPYNKEKISTYEDLNNKDSNDTNSPERDKILRLADLPAGDTIEFQFYDKDNVPSLNSYTYPAGVTDNTWIVYIPTDKIANIATTSIFDFSRDVIVITPRYATPRKKYVNSISVAS